MRKNAIFAILLAMLVLTSQAYAKENGNGNSNGNGNGNNGNSAQNRSNNSSQNANSNQAKSQPSVSSSVKLNLAPGQVKKIGRSNQDEVTITSDDFDADSDDGGNFSFTDSISDINDEDNTIMVKGGGKISLTEEQMDYLSDNNLITPDTKIQVIGNRSNNGNLVRILKIQDPATGEMVMIRLHTNAQVSQFSVKTIAAASPSASPSGDPEGTDDGEGLLARLIAFFQSVFGGGNTEPSPSPSASPSPSVSPSASPSASSSPSESPTPSPTT